MRTRTLLSLALILSVTYNVQSQNEIAAYQGLSTPSAASVANISATALSRGLGISTASGGTFNSRDWTTTTAVGDAIGNDDFVEWAVTANSGYQISITQIEIDYDRSATGPAQVSIRTNLDNYGSDIFSDAAVDVNGEENTIPVNLMSTAGGSVIFRLYGYSASGSAGTFDIEGDLDPVLSLSDIGIILRGAVTTVGSSCTPPTTPPSALAFGPVTNTSVALNWTRGSGDSVLVVVRALSASAVAPANGTRYMANATYSSGDDLGGGNYAVYTGTGTALNVSGLSPATAYKFLVYEFATTGACYGSATAIDTVTDCLTADNPAAVNVSSGNKSVTVSFVNGMCADSVLVVASTGSATAVPSGHNSQYAANAVFGSGTQIGSGEYVVLNDSVSANSISVSDLVNGQTYYFKVFNSKGTDWSPGVEVSAVPNSIATTGPIMITEIMQNPADVSDANGEYFEVYNPTATPIDMNGWTISDASSDSDTIKVSLIVPAYGFAVLARNGDLTTNGGVSVDYEYSGIALSNGDDEIFIEDGSNNGIDTVVYNGSNGWPTASGAAMVFTGFSSDDNNDTNNWAEATKREGFAAVSGDLGSPNTQGFDQRVDYQLVYRSGSWNTTPDITTGDQGAYIESGQIAILTAHANVDDLYLEPTAALDMLGNTMTLGGTAFLKSDASGYSQAIGVSGNAEWETFLNSNKAARWFNVSIPVDATLASVSLSDGAIVTLADAANPNQVNMYQYEPPVQDPTTLEGSWVAVASQGAQSEIVGYSLYLGAPYFGTLPISLTATGSLLNGNVNTPVSQANSGWNFIGNPYTSTVDWDEVINDNPNLNVNYYIFNDNNDSVWVGYNAVAGIPTVTNPGTAINQATQYIAPGQAFFVNANTASQVAFGDNQRTVLQSPPLYKKAKAEGVFLTVVTEDSTNDFTYVGFAAQAVDSFNSRLDGKKRLNYTTATPNLCSEVGGTNFMYKFLNDKLTVKSVPINFELGKTANNVSVTAIFKNRNTKRTVELEDKLTGIFTDLTVKGYSFNHQLSFSKDRFVLHFGINTVGVEEAALQGAEIFAYLQQGELKINLEQYAANRVDIALMDISGRSVATLADAVGQSVQSVSLAGLARGVYVVRVSVKGVPVYTEKIVKE